MYEDDDPEEVDGDVEDEEDEYYDNDSYGYAPPVVSPPTTKRILPSIPSLAQQRPNYPKKNFLYDQYKDKNNISDGYPRVPSIYVDSPTLSPALSANKGGTAAFDYRDQHSDDSASIYQYSDNSPTVQGNQKTYRSNHRKTNTMHRYKGNGNFIGRGDEYASNDEEEYDEDSAYPVDDDYYDYEEDAKSDVDERRDDDINNNQLTNSRGVVGEYAQKLCSPFKDKQPISETYDAGRRPMYQERGKAATLTRQPESFGEQFEWTFNELPDEEYEPYGEAVHSPQHALPEPEASTSILAAKSQLGTFYKQIDSIVEEEDYEEDDDVTVVSPVNSSSLSPRSLNYLGPDKEAQESYEKDETAASPYHEDTIKSPTSDEVDRAPDTAYRSPYKTSLADIQPTLMAEGSLDETDPNRYLKKLEVIGTESRKASLKDENSAEVRRQKARDRWHNAYDKIIHQLNVSTLTSFLLFSYTIVGSCCCSSEF